MAPPQKGRRMRRFLSFTTALDEVYREIEIMKAINHKNLTKVVEVIDDPDSDKLYVIMEIYNNGELTNTTSTPTGMVFLPNACLLGEY
jgi:serine/threonine protein kinase